MSYTVEQEIEHLDDGDHDVEKIREIVAQALAYQRDEQRAGMVGIVEELRALARQSTEVADMILLEFPNPNFHRSVTSPPPAKEVTS